MEGRLRHTILAHYGALHRIGVIHGDVEPRHWLRHPVDGSIRIIDFDMARVVGAERAGGSGGRKRGENENEIDNEGVRDREWEMGRVRDWLGIRTSF
jgi:serine/threonine protein kinase